MNKGYNLFKNICRVLLLIFIFIPLIWGIRTSLLADQNDRDIIPQAISFSSYANLLDIDSSFWSALRNSVITGFGSIVLLVPFVILGSYALSRINFKGKRFGKIFLYLPLIPSIVLLSYLSTIINNLGLINNLFAVMLLNVIFLAPFCMWILRNFMRTISPSLEEAATIDGCGRFRTLISIILPNSWPGIITIMVYTFIQSWLMFLYGYAVIYDESKMIVPQLVQSFIGIYATNYTTLCTFSIIALIPPILFFVLFQRWFIAGLFGNMSK